MNLRTFFKLNNNNVGNIFLHQMKIYKHLKFINQLKFLNSFNPDPPDEIWYMYFHATAENFVIF